jgi:hypothetical protein
MKTVNGRKGVAVGLATLTAVAFSAAVAVADVPCVHGNGLVKVCVGPGGLGAPIQPGQTIICTIQAVNLDTCLDAVQIDSIVDCVHHTAGDICTGNLLSSPAVLAGLGNTLTLTHTDVAQAGDGPVLKDSATMSGTYVGLGLPFSTTAPGASSSGPCGHGIAHVKNCVGPAGLGAPVLPGQTVVCTVQVISLDTCGDAIRINSVEDCVHHRAGDICTGNLLSAPAVLATLGDTLTLTNTDVVQAGDGPSLTDTATASGTDLGVELPVSATVPASLSVAMAGCGAAPIPGCRTPGQAMLQINNNLDDGGDKLSWRWIKGLTTFQEFGDPANGSTDYRICVYDTVAGVPSLTTGALAPAGGICAKGQPCWKAIGRTTPKGFVYNDKGVTPDGYLKIALRARTTGKGKITVRVAGLELPMPALPLNQDPEVIVQLSNSEGGCWEAVYAGPSVENTSIQFKMRVP